MLGEIVRHKREEVAAAMRRRPAGALPRPGDLPPARDFRGALAGAPGEIRIVAELKKASPSRGVIRADFDPGALAESYARGGAAALSVLTDQKYFQGKLEYLETVASRVSLPLLRKDFIVDPYQIRESRAAGADAILLIVAALARAELADLHGAAREAGLQSLVEVHSEEDLDAAAAIGAEIIGINNRNLETFEVSLDTTRRLAPKLPRTAVGVCESGIATRADLTSLAQTGVRCFLIGEQLMTAADPGARLAELLGAGEGRS
jgi:indole-3-glycerol phosphate synthase